MSVNSGAMRTEPMMSAENESGSETERGPGNDEAQYG